MQDLEKINFNVFMSCAYIKMYVVYLKFVFSWDESDNLTLGINYLLYLYKAAFHKSPEHQFYKTQQK